VSSQEKVDFLKNLGCDRVINYKTEDLNTVLKKEYPNGVDLIYESVGGDTFDTCVNNLAVRGRLIVIGSISGYKDGSSWKQDSKQSNITPLATKLLTRSASVRGFFMNHYSKEFKRHLELLIGLVNQGKLKSIVDTKQFSGLEQIADAVDHLYRGANIGKVFVEISPPDARKTSARL